MKLKSVSQTIFRQPESKLSVKLTANVLDFGRQDKIKICLKIFAKNNL